MSFEQKFKWKLIFKQPHKNFKLVNKIEDYQFIGQNSLRRINNCHTI